MARAFPFRSAALDNRRMRHTLRAAVLILGCLAGISRSSDVTLARDGKSDYVILVDQNAPPAVKRGATELQRFVQQIADVKLPVVETPDAKSPAHAIVVRIDAKGSPESYDLRTHDDSIEIIGG